MTPATATVAPAADLTAVPPLALLAAVAAAAAAALLLGPRRSLDGLPSAPVLGAAADPTGGGAAPPAAARADRPAGGAGALLRRLVPTAGAAVVAGLVVGGAVGAVVAALVGAVVWRALGRAEPRAARREREQAAADLPVLVDLLASALAAGTPVDRGVAAVCDAWAGPATRRLREAEARLALGADPVAVWQAVAADPPLAPLGRALARAASSGAPVATVVAALADDLAEDARAGVEDAARTVGVRAALPLGLCLLPAFVLLGIVPLAAGLLSGIVG